MSSTSAADNDDDRIAESDHQPSNIDSQDLKQRMEEARALILEWETKEYSLSWDESNNEAFRYLAAVDDVLAVVEDAGLAEVLDTAKELLQSAMVKLEENFRLVLITNAVPLDTDTLIGPTTPVSVSASANNGAEITVDNPEISAEGVSESGGGGDGDGGVSQEPGSSSADNNNTFVELIHSEAVHHLREIAKRMIKSGYDKECCEVYTSVRKDVLDEFLAKISIDKVSIEDVQKMDWSHLQDAVKKWTQAVKVIVNVLLYKEKNLCGEVFEDCESVVQTTCFTELSKGCVMQLLSFSDAVAIVKRSSKKLYEILNMYDVLHNATPRIEELFNDETGEIVCLEASESLKALGEAAMGTLSEFKKQVKVESSKILIQGGEIHPMTTYVMNNIRFLVEFRSSLNQLLVNYDDDLMERNNQVNGAVKEEDISPIRKRLLRLTSYLEEKLKEKAKLYEDVYLGYVFIAANISYMVQEAKDSEVITVLGDAWRGRCKVLIKNNANSYLKGCWRPALLLLSDIGSDASSTAIKENLKKFNAFFERMYRIQTGWKIRDAKLRNDFQVMISEPVTNAYRSFTNGYWRQIESFKHPEKYLKYSVQQLDDYLQDLFQGLPRDLSHQRRNSA